MSEVSQIQKKLVDDFKKSLKLKGVFLNSSWDNISNDVYEKFPELNDLIIFKDDIIYIQEHHNNILQKPEYACIYFVIQQKISELLSSYFIKLEVLTSNVVNDLKNEDSEFEKIIDKIISELNYNVDKKQDGKINISPKFINRILYKLKQNIDDTYGNTQKITKLKIKQNYINQIIVRIKKYGIDSFSNDDLYILKNCTELRNSLFHGNLLLRVAIMDPNNFKTAIDFFTRWTKNILIDNIEKIITKTIKKSPLSEIDKQIIAKDASKIFSNTLKQNIKISNVIQNKTNTIDESAYTSKYEELQKKYLTEKNKAKYTKKFLKIGEKK